MSKSLSSGLVIGAGIIGKQIAISTGCKLIPLREISTSNIVKMFVDALMNQNPDYIVCAFALTSLIECELHPEKAYELNYLIPKQLSEYCQSKNIYSLHCSSDYANNPINIYGYTKAMSERLPFSSILRFNYINKTHWLYQNICRREPSYLLSTNKFNPVSLSTVIETIKFFISERIYGIHNLGLAQPCSYFEVGQAICNHLDISQNLLVPTTSIETAYPYPYNSFIKPNLPQNCTNDFKLPVEMSKL